MSISYAACLAKMPIQPKTTEALRHRGIESCNSTLWLICFLCASVSLVVNHLAMAQLDTPSTYILLGLGSHLNQVTRKHR